MRGYHSKQCADAFSRSTPCGFCSARSRSSRCAAPKIRRAATAAFSATTPPFEYDAVHVGYAKRGEAGSDDRWIVLCDRVPHTELHEALVVELRATDGALLTIRKPR
jgi:hypothetical protein